MTSQGAVWLRRLEEIMSALVYAAIGILTVAAMLARGGERNGLDNVDKKCNNEMEEKDGGERDGA